MTREEAIEVYHGLINTKIKEAFEFFAPELRESEDERIRNKLYCTVLGTPDDSEWFHDVSKDSTLAYLEKQKKPENVSASTMAPSCWAEDPSLQKEQKPVVLSDKFEIALEEFLMNARDVSEKTFAEDVKAYADRLREIVINEKKEQKPVEIHNPTDEEIEVHRKQLHDFKAFIYKQAQEHNIGLFYHDVNWEAFCGEILSYLNEKQKPEEWSEEDEKILRTIISDGSRGVSLDKGQIDWLKSLRPSWKPSEEQMKALNQFLCVGALSYIGQATKLQELYIDLKELM